ncbi:MAG: hypothetical protein GX230_02370 [Lentisphaerae bacterium]|jgi:beta-galactosidase|nr:hypothetical protein [Lentisphaerota bacterium]
MKVLEWQNPALVERNRAMAHVPWGVYESVEQALSGDRRASQYVRSLNGMWKFMLYANPEAAPDFAAAGFDVAEWHDMPVPSNWQLRCCGLQRQLIWKIRIIGSCRGLSVM